jgi:uncharacterized membrane protein
MLRFQWKFAAGAVAALVHDVILTVGFFSIFRLQFDLTVLYSSIYTASATALYLDVNAQDLLPPAEDSDLVDDLP